MGGGMGRGMGRGGAAVGGGAIDPAGTGPSSQKAEVAYLRQQADAMRNQLEAIESKLKELEDD